MREAFERDGKGQPYRTINNVRITLVERMDGWAGPSVRYYLRIQAHRSPEQGGGLNMGAELPLRDAHESLAMIGAMCELVALTARCDQSA